MGIEKFVIYARVSMYNESVPGVVIDGSVDIVIKSGFETMTEAREYIDYHGLLNCKAGVYYGSEICEE